ncbi:hypothetical protein K458DRAFT_334245 [Lentithecium fluviatile CBS 122367]|uniref:Nucleoporin Nup120/160 n=1 Tax=Lentithecium fluviatile CBS 122367 TaxID=1168545 RepID=A0A6G1J8H2_9PLEO|nr:hypothetical protein K458DRAFT_334245 [Lentithecium fluviatile CBS 122367]
MAKNGGTCLYKEARLNIEPAYPGSTISITLPASGTWTSRPKRTVINETYTDQDDDAFTRRHLASDGSMFFRRHHKYPRSFLWRLLDSRKTLEIQATDFDQDGDNKFEANLTLLLHFASAIRPFCTAFAEPEDRDALTVFAITNASELYTITLHRDFFAKPAASEQEIGDWCKRSSLTLLQNNIPYRLVAVNFNELLVSLDNGAIVRLTRSSRDDMVWSEAVYQQNSWSLRGMLPWKGQQTVRFDNADLSVSSVAAMALSPDGKHIISVCLDHRLQIYNVESGKLTVQQDLLHRHDGLHERNPPYFIAPSQSALLQVVNMNGGPAGASYHIVTYSPVEHQFKFWGVRDADDDLNGIYDTKQDTDFIPPVDELMQASVWTMEEFFLVSKSASWRNTELWIRGRSGPSCKVYSLCFDLQDDDVDHLAHVWRTEWATVDPGPLTVEGLRKNSSNPGEQERDLSDLYETDSIEQWLEFLFYPGRFTMSTLETALLFFRKGLDRTHSTRSPRGSLKERLCATVSAFALRSLGGADEPDRYEQAIADQWQAFYGLVKDLHKRRGESLSLAYDIELDMPWLVLSDYLSAIRKCSKSETIALSAAAVSNFRQASSSLHRALPNPKDRAVSKLLNAAAFFRRRFPPSLQQELKRQVEMDLLQNRAITIVDRMEFMEEGCNLWNLLTEEDLASLVEELVEELGTETKSLTTAVFIEALQTLVVEESGQRAKRKQIARYGLHALVRISQETIDMNYNILLDLLLLILFLQSEADLSEHFDASEVFVELLAHFQDYTILKWLATAVWSRQSPTGKSTEELLKALGETHQTSKFPMVQTVLEGVYGGRAFDFLIPSNAKSGLFTYWSRAWISSVFEQDFDIVVDDTMGILLAQKEYGLAADFSKFLSESSWATYLKGRLHIALGENSLASVCFRKAAYNLGLGMFNVEDSDSAALVSESERNYFSEGLPKYYHHVLGLFEKAKAYTYTADFARSGLRMLMGNEDEELKTELLQRLFTASLQTSRFEEAYTAMTRHSDAALKHSSLQSLITSMVSQSQTAALFRFPFVGLVDDVDAILANLCHKTLNLASGPPYHQILYSFRISRGNFRGAASILHERLQRLKSTSSKHNDPTDESLTHCYLMIINALSSVSEDDAYILADQRIDDAVAPSYAIGKGKKLLKRQIITLDTLRKEYQAELDRIGAIETGQFPLFDPADDMDIL